jgi:hypothetical protein
LDDGYNWNAEIYRRKKNCERKGYYARGNKDHYETGRKQKMIQVLRRPLINFSVL